MTTETTVWLCDDLGQQLYPFADCLFNYTKVINGAGKLHGFSTPADDLPRDLVKVDYQLQFWRRPEGGTNRLDFLSLLRHWKWRLNAAGIVTLVIEDNKDQNELLERRVVAYKSGTAQAIASNEAADDAMKRVFDQNFLAGATDADREIQANSVTVEGDETAGPLLDKGFSYQPVLELFQEINQETRQAETTEVFFELGISDVDYAQGKISLQFQTFTGQPGKDRTHDTDNPVIFSPDFGNVEDMELVYDYRGEENAVYVAGQGVGARRTVVEVEDEEAQAASAWNRREGFVDARDISTVTDLLLQARGRQRINETRPRVRVNGRVRSTEHTLYGRDWGLGDRVTVNGLGVQFDAIIRVVNVRNHQVIGLMEAEL